MATIASTAEWRSGRELMRVYRPVLVAVVGITLLSFLGYVALALEAMLMLDVALPGRNGETVFGLLAMILATIMFIVGCISLRQRLFRQGARAIARQFVSVTSAQRFGQASGDADPADGRHMDRVRDALSGGSAAAVLDAALLPLYAAVMLLLGWPMALMLLFGGAVSLAWLYTGRGVIRQRIAQSDASLAARDAQLDLNRLSHRDIREAGLAGRMRTREHFLELAALDPADDLGRAAWRPRITLTVLVGMTVAIVSAIAVWRATVDRAGIGTIAASFLLAGFALVPVREVAVRQLELLRARDAWRQLVGMLDQLTPTGAILPLPAPTKSLGVEGVAIPAAGERRVVLQGVTFEMQAGDIAVVVGPADTGKSMLLRALAGLAPNAIGNVRLDGATLAQYGEDARARHIGYLSQDCDLLPGTISQIISGFAQDADPEAIVRAAQATGAHEVIVRLPRGYDTLAGGADCALSQSIRQRIALTRAFYGDPFLLLLDTPDSFQDRDSLAVLGKALQSVRDRGAIALVVGTSNEVIGAANLAMVLRKGGIADFGPKDEVRGRMQMREKIKSQASSAVAVATAVE